MVGIDVQHHGQGGMQLQKAAAELTGLCQESVALAHTGAAADGIQHAADVNAGIQPTFHQDLTEHGRGGGLSVGAAHAYRMGIPFHQLPQKKGTLQGGNAKFGALLPFWVVLRNGSGIGYQVCPMNVLCPVTDHYLNAFAPEVAQQIAVGSVRPGDLITFLQQHFCQAGHAGAADADHMDAFADIVTYMRNLHERFTLSLCNGWAQYPPSSLYTEECKRSK